MSKARQSKKRVVLRRAAKRRARYEGGQASLVSAQPPAYLRWALGAEERPSPQGDAEADERNLIKV